MFLQICSFVLILSFSSYNTSSTFTTSSNDSASVVATQETMQSFQDSVFKSKNTLLSFIRSYLAEDQKIPAQGLAKTMEKLSKLSFQTLAQKYQGDSKFVSRYRLLEYLKIFLMRYRHESENDAHDLINALQKLSSDQIKKQYYSWCATLTKNQMLEMIHDHEQFDRGFSGQDADRVVRQLADKPLSAVRDRFMDYQHTFVTKDLAQDSNETIQQRKIQREITFTEQQSKRSFVSRIPLVHNSLKLLPPSITHWSEQKVYEQIQAQMKKLGFDQHDIESEMYRLRSSSIETLERDYPHLQDQLAQRLYYFDTSKHQGSQSVKTVDFWLQQLHQWGSTVAMVASYGASAAGLDPAMLNVIAGSTLLNSSISHASGYTKRDFLDMIYAQYVNFDILKNAYFSPEHKADELLTKAQLLEKISQRLDELNISGKVRIKQEVKYKSYNKEELEELYQELDYFAHDEHRPVLSSFEKKIVQLSKVQLLEIIRVGLGTLKISRTETDQTIKKLGQQDIKLIRTATLDMHECLSHTPLTLHKIPSFISKIEMLLGAAPKSIATSNFMLNQFSNNLRKAGKSDAYIHWKVAALQNQVEDNNPLKELYVGAGNLAKANTARSFFVEHQDLLGHVHALVRPVVDAVIG